MVNQGACLDCSKPIERKHRRGPMPRRCDPCAANRKALDDRLRKRNLPTRPNTARGKRAWITQEKRQPCMDCKRTFPPVAMQFDHILERGPKLFMLSQAVSEKRTFEEIKDERAKCDLVCANCHAIRTSRRHGERRVLKITSEAEDLVSEIAKLRFELSELVP